MRSRRKTQGTVRSWMRFSLSGTKQSWLQSSHYIPIHYAIFEATPIQDWDCRLRYIANPIVLFQPWPQATLSFLTGKRLIQWIASTPSAKSTAACAWWRISFGCRLPSVSHVPPWRKLCSGHCEFFGEMSLAKAPYRAMGKKRLSESRHCTTWSASWILSAVGEIENLVSMWLAALLHGYKVNFRYAV